VEEAVPSLHTANPREEPNHPGKRRIRRFAIRDETRFWRPEFQFLFDVQNRIPNKVTIGDLARFVDYSQAFEVLILL
jgi:hypothetical protein